MGLVPLLSVYYTGKYKIQIWTPKLKHKLQFSLALSDPCLQF